MPSLEENTSLEILSQEHFAALMAELGPYPEDKAESPLAVAVSGGADSLSLAFFLRRWRVHIVAFIVDHALRKESADEAFLTRARLQKMGIEAHIIRLAPLPSGCVQEKAREARFAVLERACRQRGAQFLCVAHHKADQEETLWMRYERKSEFLGMCGMARKVRRGCIILLRPLLECEPRILRNSLQAEKLDWCEDPSNQNRAFKRVQIRQDLKKNERVLMHRISDDARKILKEREKRFSFLMDNFIVIESEGWARFSPFLWQEAPEDVLFLLKRLIRCIGGEIYPPSQHALARLMARGYGSLGRAILKISPSSNKDTCLLMREERGVEERVAARFSQRWDRRWRYDGEDLSSDYFIAALGEKLSHYRVARDIPATVLATIPALWKGEELVAVPKGVRGLDRSLARCPLIWDPAISWQNERIIE